MRHDTSDIGGNGRHAMRHRCETYLFFLLPCFLYCHLLNTTAKDINDGYSEGDQKQGRTCCACEASAPVPFAASLNALLTLLKHEVTTSKLEGTHRTCNALEAGYLLVQKKLAHALFVIVFATLQRCRKRGHVLD